MKNFIYDYLSAQGRKGDSALRNVNGELSHVNPREARAIDDYGVLGELFTKEVGAGTSNPYTGLSEYNTGDVTNTWGSFQDMNPDDFINMTDEDRLGLATDLGYSGMTQDDMDRYMPSYDTRGEENIMFDTAQQISDTGEGAQTNLMQLQAQENAGGFEATGNPMIDHQRENIFGQINKRTSGLFRNAKENIHQLREQAQQKFGDRVLNYETMISAEEAANAPKEKGMMTKAWDSTFGALGKGIGKMFSDERLKDNMEFQYVDEIGMPVYSYNYTYNKNNPQMGYMAQDVEKVFPDAVSESQGFKKVDYGMIISRAKSIGKKVGK